jgi:SAM-dependent methyltransferase
MDGARTTTDPQATRWNGLAGRAWVEAQAVLDGVLAPFDDLLLSAVPAGSGSRVLDVGCGTGATTVAIARRLGAQGHTVGVDISDPMIAAARIRAERAGVPATFVRADAQEHPFEAGGFDVIVSRFGVMFFEDPVRAFANLRRAAGDGAELRFVAWRGIDENPFMTTAERAAAPLLPGLPERRPDGPGQFALADPDRVRRILVDSGWTEVDVRPVDVPCTMPASELEGYFTRMGPVGTFLHEVDEPTRARVVEVVRDAFAPYVHGAQVRYTAACWRVGARAMP